MSDQKKVLVFARHPGGGIRTYFRYVYGQPCMADMELVFITPASTAMDPILSILKNSRGHITSGGNSFSLFWALFKNLFTVRFDLIHSHGFTAGMLAAIPARVFRIPHVVTTHDVLLEPQFRGLKGRLRKWVVGRLLGLASVINPVGKDAGRNLIETYPFLDKPGKVVEVQNGIDIEHFHVERIRNLRQEASLPDGSFLLGFFGRFMAQKGFGTLVNAVELWNQYHPEDPVIVACFGWGGFIREEQAALKARSLEQYFRFFPNTNDMPEALRGVDAVVMPSRWEACPLLPMEAFVAGVPVIATQCIGLAEVTKDTPTISFEIGSPESLVEALAYFREHQQEIAGQVKAYRAEAAKRFDVQLTASRLRVLMDSVIPEHKR